MSASRNSLQPFGALKEGALYIERAADRDLQAALQDGQYCVVSAPRQYGKSSLGEHTCRVLTQLGTKAAMVDLTLFSGSGSTGFYEELIKELASKLDWSASKRTAFLRQPLIEPGDTLWHSFLRKVTREAKHEIVLVFDEVDCLLEPSEQPVEFFRAFRDLQARRETDPAFRKLSMCLLGVLPTPAQGADQPLLKFASSARRIQLEPFARKDLHAFRPHLEPLGDSDAILSAVYDWTSGHPQLTHRLCHALRDHEPILEHTERAQVERLVETLFLQPNHPDDDFLNSTRLRIEQLKRTPEGAELVANALRLYRRVLEASPQEAVKGNPHSPLQEELTLWGLCRIEGGLLVSHNRIAARFFDLRWAQQNIPRRWFDEALSKWLGSSSDESARDKDLLLSGWQLAEAERWLEQEQLSAIEREYIRQSQQAAQRARNMSRAWPYVAILVPTFIVIIGASWIYFILDSQKLQNRLLIMEGNLTEMRRTDGFKDQQIRSLRKEIAEKSKEIKEIREKAEEYKRQYDELIMTQELDQKELQQKKSELERLKELSEERNNLLGQIRDRLAEKEKTIASLKAERDDLSTKINEQKKSIQQANTAIANAQKALGTIPKAGVDAPFELKHSVAAEALALSGGGDQAVTATPDGQVHFWRSADSRETAVKAHGGRIRATAIHQPSNRAASAGADGQVVLYELSTGKKLRTMLAHPGGAIALAFSPDGKWLLSGGEDQQARIWNASTGESVATFAEHKGSVSAVAFSGNSSYAITGSADKTARIWEYVNNEWKTKNTQTLDGHKNWVAFVWLNAAGNRALVGTSAGRTDLWNIDVTPPYRNSLGLLRDKFMKFLKDATDRAAKGPILATMQSGQTTYFASADSYNVVWVWEAFTGKPVQRLQVGEANQAQKVVNAATFSADGKYIATASDDGVVRIWRLKLDG